MREEGDELTNVREDRGAEGRARGKTLGGVRFGLRGAVHLDERGVLGEVHEGKNHEREEGAKLTSERAGAAFETKVDVVFGTGSAGAERGPEPQCGHSVLAGSLHQMSV